MVYTSGANQSSGAEYSSPENRRTAGGMEAVGTDAFLQLLVTQLQYQDPLDTGQDTGEFVTQLAMLSLLEQTIQLQRSMEEQAGHTRSGQLLNLLNREVELRGGEGELIEGRVSSVDLQRSEITVNGESYPFGAVIRVEGGP